MVKELSWYIEKDRFSDIVNDIEEKACAYEGALKAGADDAAELREEFRSLCQWHVEKSGYKKGEESFVSVDDEFFDGTELNRTALNAFEKEVVKAHMYQKHLWEFMGTTGSMTIISKAAMKKAGYAYEDFLPKGLKEGKEANPHLAGGGARNPNEVDVYMYADGTVSTAYDGERAKYRFDVLKDKSGFDWNRIGWDPNYQVRKDGWHGRYNDEGAWERVDTPRDATEGAPVVETGGARLRSLELLKVGDGGILYDPGYSLLTLPEIVYLLLDDSVYGSEAEDVRGTVREISEAMQALGISRISAVAGINTNTAAADDGEKISRYKAVLGDMAAENLEIKTLAEYQKVKDDAVRSHQDSERQVAGRRLCAGIRRAAGGGLTGTAVLESVKSGAMRVPLVLESAEDRQLAGLTDEAYGRIKSYGVPEDKKAEFERAAVRLSAEYELIKDSGLSMETLLEEAYRTVVQGKRSEATVTLERTFGELCLSEGINYHGQRPDGYTAGMLRSEISSVPLQGSKETQRLVDRALANVEENFEAVRASTGMTPAEAVRAAVKVAGGKNIAVFVPPVSGFVPRSGSAEKDDSARRIYLDIPLSALIEDAVSADPPTKTVSLWADYRNEPDYTDEGLAYNLLDGREREAWFGSGEFNASGMSRAEAEAFLLAEDEKIAASLLSSPEPVFEVSSGERLSQKYGAGASGGKKPEECVIARIVPKSVSLGSVDAAARANGAAAASAVENAGGIAAKRYSAAAVRMNGKLARSIAAARTVESLAREAPAPKAKAAPDAGDEPEGAVFEADEAAESGVQGVAPQEAFEGLRESVGHYAGMAAAAMTDGMTVNVAETMSGSSSGTMPAGIHNTTAAFVPGEVPSVTAGGEPAATQEFSQEFTSDFSPEFSPEFTPDVTSGSTPHGTLAGTPHVVVGGSPVVTADGMTVNVAETMSGSSSGTMPAGIHNTTAVSVPGEVPSVTAGGEPAATQAFSQDFTSDFTPEFSPDVISGGTLHVVVGGSPVVTADGMPVNVAGTPSGSRLGTMPTKVYNTAAVSVPGEVPSVTVGGESAATQEFTPEFTSDFSPEFSPDVTSGSTPHGTLAGTPHVVVGGSPVVTADGMTVNVAGTPSGSRLGTMPTKVYNTAAVSVPGEVPSVTVGGEPASTPEFTPEFTSDFSPEALQRPSAAGSGSEPSVRDAGASPGPNEPYGNSPQAYAGGGPLSAVSNDGAEGDEEKARMERMSTNYERDREILAKEDPAFSRTTFRDVGHAMSDAEFDFNEKNSRRRMRNDVEKVISKVRL